MRNSEVYHKRNKDLRTYFGEEYARLQHGSASARYNVAVAKTADKFYLSVRRVEHILHTPDPELVVSG